METATAHVHHGSKKDKIVKVNGDRYFQSYCICECRAQFNVRLTELKKGPYRANNH